MELQKIALLIELVGVTVQERKDRLELWNSVLGNFHERRLVGLDHGHWAN